MRTRDIPMKPAGFIPVALTFLLAAAAALYAAIQTVSIIERRSVQDVTTALEINSLSWVDVTANGLQLALLGTAPDEAARFRAMSVAGGVVDTGRLVDQMDVQSLAPITPPEFSIELLRSDDGITLVGLIPDSMDRAALLRDVARAAPNTEVTDLLDVASFMPPAGWDDAVSYGVATLRLLDRAKVSIDPQEVGVISMAPDRADRDRLERSLRERAPDGLRLALDVTSPRPVLTPFLLRVVKDGDGARFEACSAASEMDQSRILIAAREVGVSRDESCEIGLGAPNENWADAAEAALAALLTLPDGQVSISDVDVQLSAGADVGEAVFQQVVDQLEAALPVGYSLSATLSERGAVDASAGPAEFIATRSPEGEVRLRGRLGTFRSQSAVESFAEALFGFERVENATDVSSDVPQGWVPRVLVSLDALALLHNGSSMVSANTVVVRGVSGRQGARDEIARMLTAQLGDGATFQVNVRYDERLDPTLSIPTPEECVAQINQILSINKISFEPGSDEINAAANGTLDAIAELLRLCEGVPMEIGGFTDSQGREVMNRDLSESRALSVLRALSERRVLTASLTAKGYGEENPIADNGTEEGREANRRIEFTLLIPEEEAEAEQAEGGE